MLQNVNVEKHFIQERLYEIKHDNPMKYKIPETEETPIKSTVWRVGCDDSTVLV